MTPRVSVLMAVHNGERFLRQAIESVLRQTYHDFEFIIVDDHSTDATLQIIASLSDVRMRVIRNATNVGAGAARNIGLDRACGEYIAVLDADDVALASRLETQVALLDEHPGIALVTSAVELIDESDNCFGILHSVQDSLVLRWTLHFRNPIPHSSVMYKRTPAVSLGGYDSALPPAEDYALWSKLSADHTLAGIPQVLTRYRINSTGLLRSQSSALHKHSREVVRRNIRRLIGKEVSDQLAGCLHGEPSPGDAVLEAYFIYWLCVQAFHARQRVSLNHRPLFESILHDLLSLARQDETQRWRALAIAWRYAARYAPMGLLLPAFWNFAAKIISTPSWRRLFRHVVPRESNA